jgi:hypothetical protein
MQKGHTQLNPFKFLPYFKISIFVLLINTLIIALILYLRKSLPPVVPLYYGKPAGEEQLGSSLSLLLPPAISIILTIINSIFAKLTSDPFLQQVLIGLTIVVSVLSTITVLKIIFLVGSF